MTRLAIMAIGISLAATACLSAVEGNPVGFAESADPSCSSYWDAMVILDIEAGKNVIERFDPNGPSDLFGVVTEFQETVAVIEPESLAPLRDRVATTTAQLQEAITSADDVDDVLATSTPLIEQWSQDLDDYSTEIRREIDRRCPAADQAE